MIPKTTPICIVGAGPGGASASLFLTKLGIHHVILEKDVFPRDKICGDGLDLNTLRVLQHYDANSVEILLKDTENFMPLSTTRIYAPNRSFRDMDVPNPVANRPVYIICKRYYFDNWLFQRLPSPYATVITGANVSNLERIDGKLTVSFTKEGIDYQIVAPLILGADGDHSTVQRKLDARKIDRTHYAAALRQYYQGITPLEGEPRLEVYFPKALPFGYFWIFPLPNGQSNVGLGMQSAELSRTKANLRLMMKEIIETDPVIAPRFANATALEEPKGWGLPLASRLRKAYGDNYLLLGDAASVINPLSGEGIGSAMISGYIAAHLAEKALQANRFDEAFLMPYQKEVTRRLTGEINFYKRSLKLRPTIWQAVFINVLISTGIGRRLFQRSVVKWLETAFEKKLVLDI
ncbi:MAG: hypothetical protein RI894_311 [Bacteroidota bacterium]